MFSKTEGEARQTTSYGVCMHNQEGRENRGEVTVAEQQRAADRIAGVVWCGVVYVGCRL